MSRKSKERLQKESLIKKEFAKRLKLARTARKLSNLDIVKIAEHLGNPMSSSTVSQYFCGRFLPTEKRAFLWGNILNVNPYWLMGYGSDDKVIDKVTRDDEARTLKELEELFLRMSLKQQRLLVQVAKAFLDSSVPVIFLSDTELDEWILYERD